MVVCIDYKLSLKINLDKFVTEVYHLPVVFSLLSCFISVEILGLNLGCLYSRGRTEFTKRNIS